MSEDTVKLQLKFKPAEDLPESEGLWAVPLQAHEGGGTFRLVNSSFMVPLAAGDVVRAGLDGDGRYQVIDVVGATQMVVTIVRVDRDRCDAQVVVDRWGSEGADWTEGHAGILVTTWREGMSLRTIEGVLKADLDAGYAEWLVTAMPEHRTREALDEVDFELDTVQHFPAVETTYWAADDPYWATVGRNDPDSLAYIQWLASQDARVARALERGQQDRVLLYIERLNATDPGQLPPLEGPIFDPE